MNQKSFNQILGTCNILFLTYAFKFSLHGCANHWEFPPGEHSRFLCSLPADSCNVCKCVLANFILCIDFQFLQCVCVCGSARARACVCVCVCVCVLLSSTRLTTNNVATLGPSPLSIHVPLQPLFRPNSIKASRIIEWDIHVTMKVFSARFLGKSMTGVMIFFFLS